MLRKTLLLAFSALTVISIGQESTAKFDFEAPAAPAKRLFEALSKACGTSLVASGSVANDVLALRLHGVTVNEAMAKIAQTVHGEWRNEGSGWVLYRGSNYAAADERAEIGAKIADFRSSLANTIKEQQAAGQFNDNAAKKLVDAQKKLNDQVSQAANGGVVTFKGDMTNVASLTPSARAIAGILSRMNDKQIASLLSGKRNVFSLTPTRMQMAMPNGSNQIVRQFVRDAQIYREVSQRNAPPQNENRRVIINGFGADEAGDGDFSLGVGYALLINQPSFGGSNVSVSLIVADPNGKTLASGQFFVGPPSNRQAAQTAPQSAEEKSIELSDLSKELAKALARISGGMSGGRTVMKLAVAVGSSGASTFKVSGGGLAKSPPISDELRAKLLQPDLYDPMSFAPGEALTSAAKIKNENLVAYLPDSAFVQLSQLVANGGVTPGAFIQGARTQANLDITDANGWLLVSPKAPSTARARLVNRKALASTLKLIDSKAFLSLDDWATFAMAQEKEPRMLEIDDSYLRLINASAAEEGLSQFSYNGGWQMLRFYGSLSTGQRQTMQQRGRISLNTLSQFQSAIITDQIFNSFDGPMISQPNPEPGQRTRTFTFGGGDSIPNERTIVLPNGLPRDGFLEINMDTSDAVQATSPEISGGAFLTAESLAFERLRLERPELATFGQNTQYDKFRLATKRTVSFQFHLTPQVSFARELEDNTPSNRPYAPFEQLPSRFRDRVEQQLAQLRKSWGNGGGGGGQIPPP
jgi:hypothetical protein